uniref:Uncharacterized protein n=1 Tax=Oryza brachyantha TaxID=4533 RepID=J3LYK7_ORYBR
MPMFFSIHMNFSTSIGSCLSGTLTLYCPPTFCSSSPSPAKESSASTAPEAAAAARPRSDRRGSLLLLRWTSREGEEEVAESLCREMRAREASAGVAAGWTDIANMVSCPSCPCG